MVLNVVRLGVGLLLLMGVNIFLGSVNALFTQEFDKKKLAQGAIKAGAIVFCFIVTYMAGWLNPTVVVMTVEGAGEVNLLTAVVLVITGGFLFYGKEVVLKLAALVKCKIAAGELPDGSKR